jgi:hypothetical protein
MSPKVKKIRHLLQLILLHLLRLILIHFLHKIKPKFLKTIINTGTQMLIKDKTNKCIAHARLRCHLKTINNINIVHRCTTINTSTHLPNIFSILSNTMCLPLWSIILHSNKFKTYLRALPHYKNNKMKIKQIKWCLFQKCKFQISLRSLQIYHSMVMI